MVDVQSIKDRLDAYAVLSGYGYEIKAGRHYNMVRCFTGKHSDSTPSCAVNNQTGRWRCFGCGERGDVIDIIGYHMFGTGYNPNGHHFREIIDSLRGLNLPPMSLEEKQRRQAYNQPVIETILRSELVLNWQLGLWGDSWLMDWLERRGINAEMADVFRLGYTGNDQRIPKYARHRLAVSWYYRNQLVAVKLRRDPRDKNTESPKYISLRGSRFGGLFFNGDVLNYLAKSPVVHIVETELDAIALCSCFNRDDCAVSLPANAFNQEHADQLSGIRRIVVMPDRDENGVGQQSAMKIKAMLKRVKVVFPPEGFKDVGEWFERTNGSTPDWLVAA